MTTARESLTDDRLNALGGAYANTPAQPTTSICCWALSASTPRRKADVPDLTDAQLDNLIKAIGLKRPRGGSQRKPIAHGTYRGARQHRYRGEKLCEPCRLAENAYQNQRYHQSHGYLTEAEWQARKNGGTA